MREVLLLKFGEVHLKGQNRPYFLKMLTGNVRRAMGDWADEVYLSDSRIYVAGMRDPERAMARARRVFGIHAVSAAAELPKDFDAVRDACLARTAALTGTFKVEARRSDKRYPMNSMELERELGRQILEANPHLKVDVHRPEHAVCVEIRDRAYVYVGGMSGAGGLPTGTGGRAELLLSGGIDSPVAGFSVMRRGVTVSAVHFSSPPYTSERAKDKVIELARIIGAYQGGMKVSVVPFTEIQMAIYEKCPDALGTVLMRRFMMRIAQRVAEGNRALALITGESLGQVASQTMEALAATDCVVDMPVFRPLIGQDKLSITQTAVDIGTYDTSILPYEDCCTIFTPRHPATKPQKPALEEAERLLDGAAMIERALNALEVITV